MTVKRPLKGFLLFSGHLEICWEMAWKKNFPKSEAANDRSHQSLNEIQILQSWASLSKSFLGMRGDSVLLVTPMALFTAPSPSEGSACHIKDTLPLPITYDNICTAKAISEIVTWLSSFTETGTQPAISSLARIFLKITASNRLASII